MKSKELFEAFSYVEDRYLDMVDTSEKESFEMKFEKQHPVRRKSITFLIAAAICVSLLATTALAVGWIPGIFNAMKEKEPMDEALYSAAAQANTDAVPEVREVPQFDVTKFTLFEKYYDGETILLGYDLNAIIPDPLVGYVPENGDWTKIKAGNLFNSILTPEELLTWENSPASKNELAEYLPDGCKTMALNLYGMLTPEEYLNCLALLKKEGYVCVMTQDLWVGDHILINRHDIFEVLNENVWSMRYDYEVEEGSCIKLNPLPEPGRNQEEITVTLDIRSCEEYWYMDLEGNAVISTGNHQSNEIDFVLKNVNK